MTHLGLFEGIGGFSLAVKWAGGKTLAWCEWNEFGQKVLKYHFPEAEGYGDITKTDFKKYANKVDLLTGGFPCQPFSMAGKRKGTDDERYLWHEMLRAIQEVKPRFVIAENVFGITNIDGGLVFEQVCADLEAEGYEVQPFIIPACSKNAPHRRDRVWFIAHSNNEERNGRSGTSEREPQEAKQGRHGIQRTAARFSEVGNATNTDCNGLNECNCNNEKHPSEGGQYAQRNIKQSDGNGTATDTKSLRRAQTLENGKLERGRFRFGSESQTWDSFPLEPPVCGRNDGLSTELDGITFSKWRAESIKAYGNAIVPQVAYELIKQLFFPIL
jgi:DNA (cytosine-5)-methyltransferase 1